MAGAMAEIDEVLEENLDVVNKLINAAFAQGCGTMEVGPMIGSAISEFATKAIFARTQANARMLNVGLLQSRKRDGCAE